MGDPLLGVISPPSTESSLVSERNSSPNPGDHEIKMMPPHASFRATVSVGESWTSTCGSLDLSEKYATLYRGLKCLASLLPAEVNICLPKQIAGHLVWTHSSLLTASPPEAHVIRWIQRSLSPGGTLFDVGAHYGWMSIAAADCVRACGRVVAFEPSPV